MAINANNNAFHRTTWLVTGTSSGFGKELATIIARSEGLNLIATARKPEDLAYLDAFDHGQIAQVIADVTNPEQVAALGKVAAERFGGVDVLVNNAGLGYFSVTEEAVEADVRHLFEVNFFGLAAVTRQVLPIMREQRSGVIVNISSVLGLTSLPMLGYYSASKYAVEGYTEGLRQEVEGLGIQLMLAEPSGARTNWAGASGKHVVPQIDDYAQFRQMVIGTEQGAGHEPGNPAKIAQLIFNAVMDNERVPLHLPLGAFATNGAHTHLTEVLREVDALRNVSLQADD